MSFERTSIGFAVGAAALLLSGTAEAQKKTGLNTPNEYVQAVKSCIKESDLHVFYDSKEMAKTGVCTFTNGVSSRMSCPKTIAQYSIPQDERRTFYRGVQERFVSENPNQEVLKLSQMLSDDPKLGIKKGDFFLDTRCKAANIS